jgi:hypothetical protein
MIVALTATVVSSMSRVDRDDDTSHDRVSIARRQLPNAKNRGAFFTFRRAHARQLWEKIFRAPQRRRTARR